MKVLQDCQPYGHYGTTAEGLMYWQKDGTTCTGGIEGAVLLLVVALVIGYAMLLYAWPFNLEAGVRDD